MVKWLFEQSFKNKFAYARKGLVNFSSFSKNLFKKGFLALFTTAVLGSNISSNGAYEFSKDSLNLNPEIEYLDVDSSDFLVNKKIQMPEALDTLNVLDDSYLLEIDKPNQHLRVWDALSKNLVSDVLISSGKFSGGKNRLGDMKTPSGYFTISSVHKSDKWTFEGEKGVYGDYFFRLNFGSWNKNGNYSKDGPSHIGIHGTNEPENLGSRESHGCVRLDNDFLLAAKELGYLKEGVVGFISPDEGECLSSSKSGVGYDRIDESFFYKSPIPVNPSFVERLPVFIPDEKLLSSKVCSSPNFNDDFVDFVDLKVNSPDVAKSVPDGLSSIIDSKTIFNPSFVSHCNSDDISLFGFENDSSESDFAGGMFDTAVFNDGSFIKTESSSFLEKEKNNFHDDSAFFNSFSGDSYDSDYVSILKNLVFEKNIHGSIKRLVNEYSSFDSKDSVVSALKDYQRFYQSRIIEGDGISRYDNNIVCDELKNRMMHDYVFSDKSLNSLVNDYKSEFGISMSVSTLSKRARSFLGVGSRVFLKDLSSKSKVDLLYQKPK